MIDAKKKLILAKKTTIKFICLPELLKLWSISSCRAITSTQVNHFSSIIRAWNRIWVQCCISTAINLNRKFTSLIPMRRPPNSKITVITEFIFSFTFSYKLIYMNTIARLSKKMDNFTYFSIFNIDSP